MDFPKAFDDPHDCCCRSRLGVGPHHRLLLLHGQMHCKVVGHQAQPARPFSLQRVLKEPREALIHSSSLLPSGMAVDDDIDGSWGVVVYRLDQGVGINHCGELRSHDDDDLRRESYQAANLCRDAGRTIEQDDIDPGT